MMASPWSKRDSLGPQCPLKSSHQGDHQEIAGYGAGYEPLQHSHQGDHHEMAGYGSGYGPLQRSHQGRRPS